MSKYGINVHIMGVLFCPKNFTEVFGHDGDRLRNAWRQFRVLLLIGFIRTLFEKEKRSRFLASKLAGSLLKKAIECLKD